MAELSNNSGGKTFLTVFDGKLVQRVPEGTEGALARQLTKGANEGKTVHEKTYSSVTGFVTGGGIEVKDFGGKKVKEIQIELDRDTLLQLPMMFLSNFGKPLPNLNPTQAVQISVYKNKRGKAALSLKQGEDNLDWAYTRENPNGLPDAIQDPSDDSWDFRDHDKFLELKVREFFETLEGVQGAPQGVTGIGAVDDLVLKFEGSVTNRDGIDIDDIPF